MSIIAQTSLKFYKPLYWEWLEELKVVERYLSIVSWVDDLLKLFSLCAKIESFYRETTLVIIFVLWVHR